MTKDRSQFQRIGSMVALRGFLAIAIIWGHLAWGTKLELFNTNVFFLISFPGRIIVWLFFVISGYVVYFGYRKSRYGFEVGEILRFYFNRAIRILPLFYLTSLLSWISLFIIAPQDLPPWQTTAWTILAPALNINFRHGVFTFTPTWFIGILIQLYLLAPILVKIWHMTRKKIGLPLMFASLLVFSVMCHFIGYFIASSWDIRNIVACLPLFLFGFFACDILHEFHISANFKLIVSVFIRFRWVIYSLVFLAFEALFLLYQKGIFFRLPIEGIVGFLGCAIIIMTITSQNVFRKNPGKSKAIQNLLETIGMQSYGLYLWHPIIVNVFLLNNLLSLQYPPYQSVIALFFHFIFIVVGSFIIALIFNIILEKPYQALYLNEWKDIKSFRTT